MRRKFEGLHLAVILFSVKTYQQTQPYPVRIRIQIFQSSNRLKIHLETEMPHGLPQQMVKQSHSVYKLINGVPNSHHLNNSSWEIEGTESTDLIKSITRL